MNTKSNSLYITSFFASLVRYYDFALFGLSAAVISSNLMPGDSAHDKMTAFFIVFGASPLFRPIGALIFGYIADFKGRMNSIKFATLFAAISTIILSLIPNYSVIGIWSLVVLTLCRVGFLASMAGEVDIIKVYISEKINKRYRYLGISLVSFCAQIGVCLAALMYRLSISDGSEGGFLWRVNFIIGGIAGIVIFLFFLRQKNELDISKSWSSKNDVEVRLYEAIKNQLKPFVLSVICHGIIGASYNFWIIFFNAFLSRVLGAITLAEAASNNILLIIIYGFGSIVSGLLLDFVKSKEKNPMIVAGIAIAGSIKLTIVLFFAVGMDKLFMQLMHMLIVFTIPFYSIPLQVKIQSLFKAQVRGRVYSLSHGVGSLIFSSSIPALSMLVWNATSSMTLTISLFILLLSILLIATWNLIGDKYDDHLA